MTATLAATTTNQNQQRGALDGLNAEVLASSKSVLAATRGGGCKSLQSFFTPPALAEFIQSVLDPSKEFHTLDLTAGDGSLLAPYDSARRVGIEIVADQIRAARAAGMSYQGIHGDVQKVAPLLALTGQQFGRIVLNPPFSLVWDVQGKSMSSTKAALVLALSLLAPGGQGAMISGESRIEREILADPDLARAVHSVVSIPAGTFDGVELATAVLFFADPNSRGYSARKMEAARITFTQSACTGDESRDKYAVEIAWRDVINARGARFVSLSRYDPVYSSELTQNLKAVQDEHTRRVKQAAGKQAADVCLVRGKIQVSLSDLTLKTIAAAEKTAMLPEVQGLDKKPVNFLALNPRHWKNVQALAAEGLLTLDAGLAAQVDSVIEKAAAQACPMYPIKPQQRLGYLADTEQIECHTADPAKGFEAGHSYAVACRSRIHTTERKEIKEVITPEGNKDIKELVWVRKAKVLEITLTPSGTHSPVKLSEEKTDIDYLLSHFSLPDPGDLATKFPAEMEKQRETLRSVEAAYLAPSGLGLKEYQREDVARLMLKEGGILSWEQGLGKTAGAMTFVAAEEMSGQTDGNALFITPQDLIPQWQAEAKKFFGKELTWIKTRSQARQVAKSIKQGREQVKLDPWYEPEGRWYITHYEALSLGGTTGKAVIKRQTRGEAAYLARDGRRIVDKWIKAGACSLAENAAFMQAETLYTEQGRCTAPPALVRTLTKTEIIPAGWYGEAWHAAETVTRRVPQTSALLCPQCWQRDKEVTDTNQKDDEGRRLYDGNACRVCGYVHAALNLKSIAHELTTAFKQGCIIVDEGTKIKGDSLQSLAVRGLRARRKLLLTGTPVANVVTDVFHLCGWALGYDTPRFPFPYLGGQEHFQREFCVTETLGGMSGRVKVLPEVTNLSVLWKLLSGGVVRRRKEDSGETLVPRKFVPVTVPMGTAQRTQYGLWLDRFTGFYCERNPEANPAMVEMNAAILGQLHKLEYASTLPTADPDAGYFGVPVSDMTPKTLKVLEIAAMHAARGERVLIGSDVMKTGRTVADALNSKGIPAVNILEENAAGEVKTKKPADRAGAVRDFRDGNARVLCAGIQSVNMGHNMDQASVVILDGLPWAYATLDQFLARVHRLSSTRPVTVYVVMAAGSLDERKWDILERKGKAANLVLDGEMFDKEQEPLNLQQVLNDLIKRGLPAAETVNESDCSALWDSQAFTLQPIGSAFAEAAPEAVKPAATPAQAQQDSLFTFETVKPKKAAYAHAAHTAPTIQQGSLFAF